MRESELRAERERLSQTLSSLQISNDRFRAIIETAGDAILTVDEIGTIEIANPAASRIFLYSPTELRGRNIAELAAPGDGRGLRPFPRRRRRRRYAGGGRASSEGCCGDGSQFDMEVAFADFFDAGTRKTAIIIRDITERKRVERELVAQQGRGRAGEPRQIGIPRGDEPRNPHADERRRRDDRAAARHQAERRAAPLRRDRPRFRRPPAVGDQRHPRFLAARSRPAGARRGRFRDRAAGAERLRRDGPARLSPRGWSSGSSWRPGCPDSVYGDAGRIRQILYNLVGNAIKFTERGGVAISVAPGGADAARAGRPPLHGPVRRRRHRHRHPANACCRSCSSNSPRAIRRSRGAMGAPGSGLSISRKLAALMGGTIGVASDEGQGSQFWFTAALGPGRAGGCRGGGAAHRARRPARAGRRRQRGQPRDS